MHSPRGVIITRPEPGLGETALAVAGLGWVPVPAPALHVRPCPVGSLPGQPAALLLTSGQAVAMAASSVPLSVPVFAVGDRTAQKATQAGFTIVKSAQGNAQALVSLLVRHGAPDRGPLLLFSGAGQGLELAAALRGHGFRVVRRVVYRTQPVRGFSLSVAQALEAGEIAAILFFSARSAQSWLRCVPGGGLSGQVRALRAIVISDEVAKTLRLAGWRGPVSVAATPDAPAMLAALGAVGA
ncbi:MAG: uroporphyrinogen-III synthase [Acetobacter sp.]